MGDEKKHDFENRASSIEPPANMGCGRVHSSSIFVDIIVPRPACLSIRPVSLTCVFRVLDSFRRLNITLKILIDESDGNPPLLFFGDK